MDTPDVRIGARSVVKRFVSNDRGEAQREWLALRLLDEYAPDLAPAPTRFRSDADQAVVEMSRVPGTALGSTPLTPEQVRSVATTLHALHEAVPVRVLRDLSPRISGAGEMLTALRRTFQGGVDDASSPTVAQALTLGGEWRRSALPGGLRSTPGLRAAASATRTTPGVVEPARLAPARDREEQVRRGTHTLLT